MAASSSGKDVYFGMRDGRGEDDVVVGEFTESMGVLKEKARNEFGDGVSWIVDEFFGCWHSFGFWVSVLDVRLLAGLLLCNFVIV